MSSKNLLFILGLCCATQTLFSGSGFQNLFADHKALDIKGAALYSPQQQQEIIASKMAVARGLQWTGGIGVAGYLGYAAKGKFQHKPLALLFPKKHKIGSSAALITGLLGWYWERQLQGTAMSSGTNQAPTPGTNPAHRPVVQVIPAGLERPDQRLQEIAAEVKAKIAEYQAAQMTQEEHQLVAECWDIARAFYKAAQAKALARDESRRMPEAAELTAAERIPGLITSEPILAELTKLVNLYEKNQAKRAHFAAQGKKSIDDVNDEIAILCMNLRLDTFDVNSLAYQTSPALEALFKRIAIEKHQERINTEPAFFKKYWALRRKNLVRFRKTPVVTVEDELQQPADPENVENDHFDRKTYEARLAQETAETERKKQQEQAFADQATEEKKKAAGQAGALPAYYTENAQLQTAAQREFLRDGWIAARRAYHIARIENPTAEQQEALRKETFDLVKNIIDRYKTLNNLMVPARTESSIIFLSLYLDTMWLHQGDATSPCGALFNQPLFYDNMSPINLEALDLTCDTFNKKLYELVRTYCLLGINPDNALPINDDEHVLLNTAIQERGRLGGLGLNQMQIQRAQHLLAAYRRIFPVAPAPAAAEEPDPEDAALGVFDAALGLNGADAPRLAAALGLGRNAVGAAGVAAAAVPRRGAFAEAMRRDAAAARLRARLAGQRRGR